MNRKYFDTAEEALVECDALTDDDALDSEDRASIAAFYNGRQTMSTCEAEERGVSELTNHLLGYDSINTAQEQIFSIYSKSPILWHINVDNAPDGLDHKWGQQVTQELNRVIKNSGRLKPEFKSFAGEVTLFGSYHFCFLDLYDWCPRSRRPLAPRGTGTTPEDGDYFVLRDELRLKDLYAALRKEKRLRGKRVKTGWKVKSLQDAIDAIEGNFEQTPRNTSNSDEESYGPTPEEQEYDAQASTTASNRHRLSIPVYYLYTSRPDEEGCPFDLTIIARYPAKMKEQASKADRLLPVTLFDEKRFFPAAKEFLHSFFIDCNIGGKTAFHRSMGLGYLNYDSDRDTEEFFNEAMQGSKENLRRLFAVNNSADTETINRWLSGEEYSNVLPDGVQIAEVAKNPNFQYAFQTMDMLMQLTRRNAAMSISNSDGARATNELEVQALERQGRNAESIASRMNDLYDGLEKLGTTIFQRFLNESVLPVDKGYREIKIFQDRLKKLGIPISFLRKEKNGELENVTVKPNRVAGDGDKVREVMVNRSLMARLHLFSPQAQQEILRRVTAQETQDYELAEELVPREQRIDGGQVNVANNENQSSHHRGIAGYVPQLNRDDIHMIHIPEHIGGLEALIAKGKAIGWDEMDMGGFQSLMQHIGLHMGQIRNNPASKQLATAIVQKLQQLSRQAMEFANNLQAKREAEQQQMEPKDVAKLQLEGAKFQLATRQQEALEMHREADLDFKRDKAGVASRMELMRQDAQASNMENRLAFEIEQSIQEKQENAQQARGESLEGGRKPQGRGATVGR